MKIILRPSDPTARHAAPVISITTPIDGMPLSDVLEQLIVPALVAFGFHPQSIQDTFRDHEVPGAAPRGEDSLAVDDFSVPEGFAYIGYGADVDGDFSEDDVLYAHRDAASWQETRYINGGDYHYAVRTSSPANNAYLATL